MGVTPNFETVEMIVDKDDTTAIYTGDPVKLLSTGYIAQWSAGTAVSQLAGIFWGCRYLSTSLGRVITNNYWPGSDASGDVTALVIPCVFNVPQYFVVQTDSTGATFADKYRNYDVALGTGSTANGRSGAYLDLSTGNTTATLPFRLVDLWGGTPPSGRGNVGSGTESGAYNWVIVAANVTGTTGL